MSKLKKDEIPVPPTRLPRLSLGEVKAKRPKVPALDAPQKERERYHGAMRRWLPSYEHALREAYGEQQAVRVVDQEQDWAEFWAMTPEQMKSASRAAHERLRNLLGRDYEIIYPVKKG